ncbi:unnamed protein product, partial [Pleuronectes platessa]
MCVCARVRLSLAFTASRTELTVAFVRMMHRARRTCAHNKPSPVPPGPPLPPPPPPPPPPSPPPPLQHREHLKHTSLDFTKLRLCGVYSWILALGYSRWSVEV